jgi:hypothetical protein
LSLPSLRISARNTPSAEGAVDGGEDSPFIPEDSPVAPPLVQLIASTRLEETVSRTVNSTVASPGVSGDGDVIDLADWSAEDRRLYRHFCEDVKTAEGQ